MEVNKLAFIIATKDRKEKLLNFLHSIECQGINNIEIIIVDASIMGIKEELEKLSNLDIKYFRASKASLPYQRNIGISLLSPETNLVGFFDDDMEFEKNSLKNMLSFWKTADDLVGGACFNIVTNKKPNFYFIKRIFATGTKKRGVMLRSGFATEICPVDRDIYVDWLLGGATVWRRRVLEEFKFDEWYKGYGLHEDLDFGYRVGKKYKLMVIANATIRHLQDKLSKKNNIEFGVMEILGHFRIVVKNKELSKYLFFWACFGQFLENLFFGAVKLKKGFFVRAVGNISGLLKLKSCYVDEKKKVLVVGYKYPPYGGMETITEVISESEYLENNFKLVKLFLKTRRTSNDRGKFGIKNLILTFFNVTHFIFLIIKHRPDVIYSHLAQNVNGFLRDSVFILISRFFLVTNCIHFHGSAFDKFYEIRPNFFKSYIRFILSRINRLIVLGASLKDQFRGLVGRDKIVNIYNAINIKDYSRTYKRNSSAKINITFIGYISKAKGALEVVKSAKEVLGRAKQSFIFNLYGPIVGKERNIVFIDKPDNVFFDIKEFIDRNNIGKYVKINNSIGKEEKIKILKNTDIFVFPSYSEGCALVVLEAMASGLPIIMSKVGSLPEVLAQGVNCFFIEPGDYKSLAEKILILIKDRPLRLKMGSENETMVKNFFNVDNFSENISRVWSGIKP